MSSLNPILGVASSKKKSRKRPNHVSFRPGVKKGITTTNRTPIRKPNTSTSTSSTNSSTKIAIPSSKDDTTTTTTTVDPKQTSTNNTENETTSNTKTTTTTTGTTKVGKLSKPISRPGIRPRPIIRPGGRKPKNRGAVSITPSIRNNDNNNNNNNNQKEQNDTSTQQQKDSSNDTAVVQKEVINQSALDVISTTISSSVPRGSDKFDKEKEMSMVPYQFLGKLDPSWNIPAPKQGEKTMKEFCSKFPIPRERNSRKNSNNGKRGNKNNNNDPEDVTSVVTSSSSVKLERSFRNNNHSQPPVTTNNGPAVEIINGEIVIQQSSITISNRKTMKEIDEEYLQEEGDLVVEDVTNGIIQATYRSFLKETPKTQHWTPTETHQFYNVLRQCGTDFSMMTSFFPDRTRKQLKKKYLQESRKHPRLIDLAMNPHTHLPVGTYYYLNTILLQIHVSFDF